MIYCMKKRNFPPFPYALRVFPLRQCSATPSRGRVNRPQSSFAGECTPSVLHDTAIFAGPDMILIHHRNNEN